MKKPKLNKVEPLTIGRSCTEIHEFLSVGAMQDFHCSAQLLIDRYIPDGWCLELGDIDQDAFETKAEHIYRTFKAVDELNRCYSSCSTLHVTEKIKRIVVRNFTSWLSGQFKEFGKKVMW